VLKTTSVGSFPKSEELKGSRAKVRRGEMDSAQLKRMEQEATKEWVQIQE
jgi:5-methyltetrahydropteroyltriglutamate--homocysteine methyltransferase